MDNNESLEQLRKPGRPSGKKPEKIIRPEEPDKKKAKKKKKATPKQDQVKITRDDSLIVTPGLLSRVSYYIYKNLYIIGIYVMRIMLKYRRKAKAKGKRLLAFVANTALKLKETSYRLWRRALRNLKSPFVGMSRAVDEGKEGILREIEKGQHGKVWSARFEMFKDIMSYIWKIMATVLNYTAPVAAAFVLLFVIGKQIDTTMALSVTYKGDTIGYIDTEKDFSVALQDVDSRLVDELRGEFTAGAPLFQVVELDSPEEFTSKEDLADGIVKASSDDIAPAFGLYANGELVGAVRNSDPIIEELDKIDRENRVGLPNERVEFEKAISFSSGLYPIDSVIDEKELIEHIYAEETTESFYKAKEGDTYGEIARSASISLETLLKANKEIELDPQEAETAEPAVGSTLHIIKKSPFLSVKNIYTSVYREPIPFRVVEKPNALYAAGYSHIDKPGIEGMGLVTAEITQVDGVEISRVVLDIKRLSEPVTQEVTVGVERKTSDAGGIGDLNPDGFIWPANGGYVGTGLGGYAGHTGVDINNSGGYGAPIFAAADGKVIKVVYSYVGYGNHIYVQHKNGYVTIYGHNSENYVSEGDYVSQGQIIGAVGSTGNSTGNHLHFEVRHNGQILNPVHFIGTKGKKRI